MARGNFGERLKRERELREVTLDEINSATRISNRSLEAMENEDWEKLPGGVFNRGFVRSVARYLGLDEEGLLAEYDMAHGTQEQASPPREEFRIPAPPKWVPVAAVLGLLLLLAGCIAGGIYTWRYFAARRAARQTGTAGVPESPASQISPTMPASLTVPATSTTTTTAVEPEITKAKREASAALDLLVSASAATRVRILADGALLLDAEFHRGENRHFAAQRRFKITAADSSAVLLELNDQTRPPLGEPGTSGTITLSRNDLRRNQSGATERRSH